jgi:hypothetical protein
MASLILPETVTLRLVDPAHNPLHVANVLFVVHAFANYKSDFDLAPFASNVAGIVRISRQELLAEAQAHYDSGLMDYRPLEQCKQELEIRALEPDEIEEALDARTKIWTTLLRGESARWANIEELRHVYRSAVNMSFSVQPLRTRWDGSLNGVEYVMPVIPR